MGQHPHTPPQPPTQPITFKQKGGVPPKKSENKNGPEWSTLLFRKKNSGGQRQEGVVHHFQQEHNQSYFYLCHDLDSRVRKREVAAVKEWLESGRAVHSMRDHPGHLIPMLGAGWGARLDTEAGTESVRSRWRQSWVSILQDA